MFWFSWIYFACIAIFVSLHSFSNILFGAGDEIVEFVECILDARAQWNELEILGLLGNDCIDNWESRNNENAEQSDTRDEAWNEMNTTVNHCIPRYKRGEEHNPYGSNDYAEREYLRAKTRTRFAHGGRDR